MVSALGGEVGGDQGSRRQCCSAVGATEEYRTLYLPKGIKLPSKTSEE